MRVILYVLLAATCAFGDESEDRRSKLPYIADAVGNSLPPPSNVPATVGSPVNLLTPDRYEFYTFDESGELVKRLMTLEEIQAIVAAGEETEGLVTFANDNQPTVAFNFSQPSHSKVHNVVTNVQNVLKAQMEAHKNKPNVRPTLDTPDVSESWSLILPSIFGNSGIDIVPDRNTESYITPETETIEQENLQSKENNRIPGSSSEVYEELNKVPVKVSTTTTTTTNKPLSSTKNITLFTTTTLKPTTTTKKLPPTTTTKKVTTSATTTTTTTKRPVATSTRKNKPSKPTITTTAIPKLSTTSKENINKSNSNDISVATNTVSITNNTPQYEKLSTYIPVTTAGFSHIYKKTSEKITITTKSTNDIKNSITSTESHISTTPLPLSPSNLSDIDNHILITPSPYSPPLNKDEQEMEKNNSTTMTTQSVSPSSSITSTEIITVQDNNKNSQTLENFNHSSTDDEPLLPLFDVAQSISQIASDLGSEYSPITSTTNSQEVKINSLPLESKENLEIDIPADSGTENETLSQNNSNYENFIKISTIDPQETNVKNKTIVKEVNKTEESHVMTTTLTKSTTNAPNYSSSPSAPTTLSVNNVIDSNLPAITVSINNLTDSNSSQVTTLLDSNVIDLNLSESIGDMMLQMINQSSVTEIITIKNNQTDKIITTTEKPKDSTINVATTVNSTSSNYEELEFDTTLKPLISKLQEKDKNQVHKPVNIKENLNWTTGLNSENSTKKNNLPFFINKNINSNMKINKIQSSLSNLLLNNKNQTIKYNTSKDDKKQLHELLAIPMKSESFKLSELANKTESATSYLGLTTSYNANISFDVSKISTKKYDTINNTRNKERPLEEFKKKIQKINLDDKEIANERNNSWKLIPTVPLPKTPEADISTQKTESLNATDNTSDKHIVLDFSNENQGLEVTTKDLGEDILQFTELCNELAFRYWHEVVQNNIDSKRSFVLSPYAITSMLAMMFMGAKGATSGEMNEILKLDDMVTFNPHFTLKNISDSIETSSSSGVAVSAFIRELYTDRSKGKVLTFYKERAQHFYNGHVEEINFKLISDVIRRRTNLLVKRYTWGRITEYIKSNSISMHPPLAAFSANIFETDCTGSSVEGRDGEMYFVVSPTVRQRRLVPVPAVVYKSNFLAGYDPVLDATAAALGNTNSIISTLFLMPGQQGNVVHAEDLEALEKRLLDSTPNTQTWNRLLRTLLPRVGLQLQIPRFSHKSIFNISSTLRKMGLKELFDAEHADLGGMNGPSKDLYLSDMIQLTTFVTCGEGLVGEQHHIEEYPELLQARRRNSRWATMWDEPRDYQRAFHDPHDVGDAMNLPLHLRPRQARLPSRSTQPARLKFDRPFLYFVRHNPSGMILYVGRYNPRLLP